MSFIPQITLVLGAGLHFGRKMCDLPFAWFVQTVVFVNLNKVCTSQVRSLIYVSGVQLTSTFQYFLWYLLLLPLVLPRLRISRWQAYTYIGTWVLLQGFWLSEAYQLEFLGKNVFLTLWMRGLVYVMGNCWVLAGLMKGYT